MAASGLANTKTGRRKEYRYNLSKNYRNLGEFAALRQKCDECWVCSVKKIKYVGKCRVLSGPYFTAESAACFAKASQPEESAEGKYREFD
jgi:hypothetical protein